MPRYLSLIDTAIAGQRSVQGVLTASTSKRLVISALSGVLPDGTLPEGFTAQMEQALDNLATLLGTAGLVREDIVRLAAYVTPPGMEGLTHIAAAARLGGMRPAVAVRQVTALSQPGLLIELDAEAAREG